MADYSQSQFIRQQENPAAPEGLQQESSRWAQGIEAFKAASPAGYAGDARSWFGGRNTQGVNSGWDNDFMAKTFASYDNWNAKVMESRKSKDPGDWLSTYDWLDPKKNPTAATGIAFWDDPDGKFKRGDVIENGKVVPNQNVYKVYGQETGDLMLAPLMFSGSEQARFNRDSQVAARYAREVKARADEWTENAKSQESALAYQADVFAERERILDNEAYTVGGVAAGAASGAAMGAFAGSIVPGVGTAVGAVVGGIAGALLGGAGAYANQDAIADALARGRVQADQARDRYGNATWFTSTLTEYGNVGKKLISPFGNVVQGGYDALSEGGIGDGNAAFYEYNAEGQRIANGWWQALDLTAAAADGVLQFATPAGAYQYIGTMGLSVIGQVGTLATTGGLPGGEGSAVFNERTGLWDEAVGKEFAAALGSTTIDAIQMGMGAAVTKAASASKSLFNLDTAAKEGALGLPRNPATLNGMKFGFAEEGGVAVSARATWTLLAPSEMVKWVATTWRARTLAQAGIGGQGGNRVLKGGWDANQANRWMPESIRTRVDDALGRYMPGADDYYRAALEMTTDSALRTAMLNGFAEGWEESIQAILDPIAIGEQIHADEVLRAGAYGFASGLGMGIGGRTASPEKKQEYRAKASYMMREGIKEIDPEEWRKIYWGEGVSDSDRKRMAIVDYRTAQEVNKHLKTYERQQMKVKSGSILGEAAFDLARADKWEKLHANINPHIEGHSVVMGRGRTMRGINGQVERRAYSEDAAVQSLKQTLRSLDDVRRGLELQQQSLNDDLLNWRGEVMTREAGTPELTEAEQKVARLERELAKWPRQQEMADFLRTRIARSYEAWYTSNDDAHKQRIMDGVNTILSMAFDRKLKDDNGQLFSAEDQELIRRAVELRVARHPTIDAGSFAAVLRPQASSILTDLGQEQTMYVHQTYLKPLNADHDGDHVVVMNALYLGDDELNQLRRGAAFLKKVTTTEDVPKRDDEGNKVYDADGNEVTVTVRRDKWSVQTDAADSHETRVDIASDAMKDKSNGSSRKRIVNDALDKLEQAFIQRYAIDNPIFGRLELETIFANHRANIEARVYESEQILLDDIWNAHTEELLKLADKTSKMELSWMKGAFDSFWHSIHMKLAMNAARAQKPVSTGAPQTLPQETAIQEGLAMQDAAADGLTLTTLLKYTTDAMRQIGGLHYFPLFNSAIDTGEDVMKGDFATDRVKDFVALFHQLGTGTVQTAMQDVTEKNPIEERVIGWLKGFLQEARTIYPDVPAFQNTSDALVLLANLAVPDINVIGINKYEVNNQRSTLLQVMLKKSIAIEEYKQRNAPKESPIHKRITRLKGVASPESDHSTTANRALMAVLGNVQMYKLAGRQADGLGGHLTPNQMVKLLTPLSDDRRRELVWEWKRLPGYLDPFEKKQDPPYTLDKYVPREDGRMEHNAFTMMVNAISAEASYTIRDIENRDGTASKQARTILQHLQTQRSQWHKIHAIRLKDEAGAQGIQITKPTGGFTPEYQKLVLNDMLAHRRDIARMLAEKLPPSAASGIFGIEEGEVYTASWVEEMLLEEDTGKAELMLHLHGAIAELNSLAGRIRHDPLTEKERKRQKAKGVKKEELPPPRKVTEIDPALIKSRMAETIYRIAAKDQTGFELERFLVWGQEAANLHDFLEKVNSDPMWVGDRQKLFAYFDDVDIFEEDPKGVWTNGASRSQQLREALERTSERMGRLTESFVEQEQELKDDLVMLNRLEQLITGQSTSVDDAVSERHRQLKQLMANALMFADSVGAAATDQFMAAVQEGLPAIQNKGLPEPASLGLAIAVTTYGFGYKSPLSQELDMQTSLDWRSVGSNLSGLADGKVRIMLDDGSTVIVDFTNELEVVRMLKDPRTRNLAIAVLAPTQRDVDKNNVVQHYTYTASAKTNQHNTHLKQIFADSTLRHLFSEQKLGILSYEQAMQGKGMVEAASRKRALDGTEEERTRAEWPIQKIINQFIVAYMHGPEGKNRDLDRERKDLPRHVMTVLQNLALLEPQTLPSIKRLIEEELTERYLNTHSAWARLNLDEDQTTLLDMYLSDGLRTDYNARIRAETDKFSQTDPADHPAIQAEIDKLQAEIDKLDAELPLWERLRKLPPSVSAAVSKWTQDINNHAEPDSMAGLRLAALDQLLSGENINLLVEKGRGDLVIKVRAALDNDPKEIVVPGKIKDEDWTYIGLFAATTVIRDSAEYASFGNGLKPLELEGENAFLNGLYDQSWSSLLDPFFDEQLLGLMREIRDIAKARPQGIDFLEVKDLMVNLLFSEKKLGEWTELNVTENLKAAKMLEQAPSLAALQRAGIAPPQFKDVVGAQLVTYEKPRAYTDNTSPEFLEHHSTQVIPMQHTLQDPGFFVAFMDPYKYLKLEHAFVRRIEVIDPKGGRHDFTKLASEVFIKEKSVETSGYRIFRGDKLQLELEAMQRLHGEGTYTIEVDHVDVDKKPFDPTYINSIYFDGAGEADVTSTSPGAVAEMLYRTGGYSKETQQAPLDFASKASKAFRQTLVSKYADIERAESRKVPLAEIIAAKAAHMWGKRYEHGHLASGANNALYKWLKSRHIVTGFDANGNFVRMWAEEAIGKQQRGEDLGIVGEYRLIALSESVHQTLLGRSGLQGTTAATMPVLNLQDIESFPSLDDERLRQLGLANLGRVSQIGNTVFASVPDLPPATTQLEGRGKEFVLNRREQFLTWQGEAQDIQGNLTAVKHLMGLDGPQGSYETNRGTIRQKTSHEMEAQILSTLGLPFASMRDIGATELADYYEKNLREIQGQNPAAMLWVHSHDSTPDPTKAILGKASLSNMEQMHVGGHKVYPVYGHAVAIDLDSIAKSVQDSGGLSHSDALKEAKNVIRAYAEKGVYIILMSSAQHKLRGDLAMWFREGEVNYMSKGGSSHYFEPSRIDSVANQNIRALGSALSEVNYLVPKHTRYLMRTPDLQISEGTAYVDYENAGQIRFPRVVAPILPAAMMSTAAMNRAAWNLPSHGEGLRSSWEYTSNFLLTKLEDPEVIKHLKKLSGGRDGNPKDVPIAIDDGRGRYDYGVLSFDDAMKRLIGHLRVGTIPYDTGQILMPGDFYVALSSQNQPMLMRYGFQIPDAPTIQDMLDAPLGDTQNVPGKSPIGIAIASAKIEEGQTVPPPFLVRDTWDGGDKIGLLIEGEYATSVMSKLLLEQIGGKLGLSPMPADWAFPEQPMSQRNGMRVTIAMAPDTLEDKQATNGSVIDFRELFILTGFDLRRDMVHFFYGDHPRTNEEYDADQARVDVLLNAWADMDWGVTEKQIETLLDLGDPIFRFQEFLNQHGQALLGSQWTNIELIEPFTQFPHDVTQRIGSSVLATLMVPGIRPEHVLGSQGMLTVEDRNSDTKILQAPPLLTRALGNHRFKETREEMIRRANANAAWPQGFNGQGQAVPMYYVTPDFRFKIRMRNPLNNRDMLVDATLQRVTDMPFERDAAALAASQLSQKANVSPHVTAVAAGALNAWTSTRPSKGLPNELEELFGANNVVRFDVNKGTSSMHEVFARVRKHLESYQPWESRLPAQDMYISDSRSTRTSYVKPIDGSPANPETTFSEETRAKAVKLLNLMNLKEDSLYEVDILVRQFVGRRGKTEEGQFDEIDEDVYRQAVAMMTKNVENKMQPLHGGAVPMPMKAFWQKVFDANRGQAKPWIPVAKKAWRKTEFAPDTWEGWLDTLLGQVRSSNAPFHGMYRMDLDGMLHTYQGATPSYMSMPLSLDTQRDLMLMDPKVNEYYLSMDPGMRAVLASPILLDNREHNLETLTGHDTDLVRTHDAWSTPMSSIAEQLARQQRWLDGQGLAKQKKTSVKKYYQEGLSYRESAQNTTNYFRALNHIQIINRLANPGLFASAILEVPYRNLTEHMTNLISGGQISRGGVAVSRVGQKLGLKTKFTPEQIKKIRELSDNMGSKTEWRSYLFGELLYKDLQHGAAPNKFGRKLEDAAATVARLTGDPRLGMRAKSAALRYNEAALEYLLSVDGNISIDQYIEMMSRDPLWLQKQSPKDRVSANSVGINRVARVRGTRQSAINKTMFGWIDKLENGDTFMKQFAGFMLNVPFRFKRFNVGTFLTITGMDGFDQMFAMMRDKRPTNSTIGRLQAAMRGEEYVPEEFTDFSDVIEGFDLTRPLVRGGMQQTMLLAAGLWMGSLSLDGEDEEAKRRRRMMQYLDGAYLYDPRRAENDFLYADAMFLDSVPILKDIFYDEDSGRSVIKPHWIIQQFTSPMMGIQRFINTGDVREIGWGFWDAIAAIPYSVTSTIDQANEAVDLLSQQAKEIEMEKGDTLEGSIAMSGLFLSIVSTYEKALLENNFVNALRNGADDFDRDPYRKVKQDENGRIVFENGQPVPTDALVSYVDEDGEIKQAYETRPMGGLSGAQSHAYAENNLTYALLASLFTGQIVPGESTFKRSNMLIKEQKVELPVSTKAQAEALILLGFNSVGGAPAYTFDELVRIRKDAYEAADVYWDQAQVEQEARAILNATSAERGGMSLLDKDGNEVINQAGAHSVYTSLRNGAVTWEDAVLDGIVIPWEMRDQIAKEWFEELAQEGVDKGLPEQSALYYANRIMNGDPRDPTAPGLKDILYDDRIPGDGTVKYNQLNMTYMIGPDGKPWATPFKRDSVMQAFGIPVPSRMPANGPGMGKDIRGKSVDEVLGINTGLHGLVRKPEKPYEPPEDLFDEAMAKTYTPTNYSRAPRRYSGGGGGGGYFPRLEPFPRGTAPDLPNIPTINTNNPFIRRAYVNRQRITSERERLKQWQ